MSILTHTIYQEKDGVPFQSLEITVDYDKRMKAVTEVKSITAYEFGKERIDLSEIFMKHFESDLDKLIMETDWALVYQETMIAKNEIIYE